jgi:phosphoglycerate dehydrogenase-like enzyme
MPENHLSRRDFLASGASVQAGTQPTTACASSTLDTPRNSSEPIRILTMTAFEPHEVEKIKGAAPNVELTVAKSRAEFQHRLSEAEVVFGNLTSADLPHATKVRWVQAGAAGVESLDRQFMAGPIALTNCARIFAPAITETAMGLLICLTRGISTHYLPQFARRQMKAIGTARSADHVELAGLTMGIVGMGGIGSTLARRAHCGFDMRIVGTDARPLPKPGYVDELRDPSWFPAMVPQVDVLVAAAPQTPLTERMFDERVFRSMKKTAYFLALSRGPLFDDMALVKALKEGWIAGAGLDVFPQEPPPPTHPIFDCPNVVMTPHTSGWSPDRQVRLIGLYAENVRRYAIGAPLLNLVDKKAGY